MTALAVIEGSSIMEAVLFILVLGVIFGLLWWLIDYCKVPEPFNRVARVILAILAVLLLCNALLGAIGHGFIKW